MTKVVKSREGKKPSFNRIFLCVGIVLYVRFFHRSFPLFEMFKLIRSERERQVLVIKRSLIQIIVSFRIENYTHNEFFFVLV
jgi:hypothetical protein